MKIGMLLRVLASAVMMLLAVSTGAKAISYTFTNVLLNDGGLLNGKISFDVYGGYAGFNLQTTGGAPGLDTSYVYPTFPSSNSNPFGSPTVLQFFPSSATAYTAMLQLTFDSDLMIAGPHLLLGGVPGPSLECNDSYQCTVVGPYDYPIRYVASDTAVYGVLPVPGALLFLATGAGLLGLLAVGKRGLRGRNSPAAPAFTAAAAS